MELKDTIFSRRSVRKFTDYAVSDSEIDQLLEAARWSPSWANTQCWEFIVVKDPVLIKEVTETYSSTNPARKCSSAASVLIAICANKSLAGFKKGEQSTKYDSWFMFDLGIAVQNISLMAHDLGLGSVIVGSMDHDRCSEILNVTEPYDVVAILPVGKPDGQFNAPKRRELDSIKHVDKFKK